MYVPVALTFQCSLSGMTLMFVRTFNLSPARSFAARNGAQATRRGGMRDGAPEAQARRRHTGRYAARDGGDRYGRAP